MIVIPDVGERNLLARLLYGDALMTNAWTLRLFTANTTPAETDVATTYTGNEATFTGYAAKTLTMTQSGATWAVPSTSSGVTSSSYNQLTWAATTAQNIYGYYILDGQATPALVGAENFGLVGLIAPSSTLNLTPKLQLD